jgi:hypothetical protein
MALADHGPALGAHQVGPADRIAAFLTPARVVPRQHLAIRLPKTRSGIALSSLRLIDDHRRSLHASGAISGLSISQGHAAILGGAGRAFLTGQPGIGLGLRQVQSASASPFAEIL